MNKPRNAASRAFTLMAGELVNPGFQARVLRDFRPEFKLPRS